MSLTQTVQLIVSKLFKTNFEHSKLNFECGNKIQSFFNGGMINKNHYTVMETTVLLISLILCFADGHPLKSETVPFSFDQDYQNAVPYDEYPVS